MFQNTYSEEQLQMAGPASYPRAPPEGPTLGSWVLGSHFPGMPFETDLGNQKSYRLNIDLL